VTAEEAQEMSAASFDGAFCFSADAFSLRLAHCHDSGISFLKFLIY
jgi:hypothetical protein